MGRRLKRKESVADGLCRLARKQLKKAQATLANDDTDEMVHEFRQDIKVIRALLRLLRSAIGEKTFHLENGRYRDVSRLFAPVRDACVHIETFNKIQSELEDVSPGDLQQLRLALQSNLQTIRDNDLSDGGRFERARRVIRSGRRRIAHWDVGDGGWRIIGPNLLRTYRRGQKQLSLVIAHPSIEMIHECRKRAKYLWNELATVESIRPGLLGQYRDQLKNLTDTTGDCRDFLLLRTLVLRESIHPGDEAFRKTVAEQIDRRLERLLDDAIRQGQAVYRLEPDVWQRRMRSWWKHWRQCEPVT